MKQHHLTGRNTWVQICLLCILLAHSVACTGERSLVERWEDEAWQPEAFQLLSFTGQRDGADVSFAMELQGDGARRVLVSGTVTIDPRARLAEATWEETGRVASRSGIVSWAAIDFLGGQGGRPSMGGQFVLSDSTGSRYRLNLETRQLGLPR